MRRLEQKILSEGALSLTLPEAFVFTYYSYRTDGRCSFLRSLGAAVKGTFRRLPAIVRR